MRNSINRCTALVFLTLLLPTAAHSEPLDGRLRGFDEPLPSFGTFSQSVAVEVPPFRGIEPRLSLDYVSGRTNGTVGVGWRLSGLPAVTIRPAEDAFGWDQYMLGDTELVPCADVVESPSCEGGDPSNTAYVTKTETYIRVEYSTDYYPDYDNWLVTSADGRKSLYSRVTGNYERWTISKAYDTLGNVVDYVWECPPGDADGRCYPQTIQYNPYHPVTIRFFYENRPDSVAYRGPGLVDYSVKAILRRLRTIVIEVDNSILRAYDVEYKISPATGRSLVAKVHRYGRDTILDSSGYVISGTRFPFSHAYQYADALPSAAFAEEVAVSLPYLFQYQSFDGWDTGLRTVDLNGDGLQDLLQVTSDVSRAWINGNGSWQEDDTYAANLPPFIRNQSSDDCYAAGFGDFNGDGLTDVATSCPSVRRIYVRLNNGAGFEGDSEYTFSYPVWEPIWGSGDLFVDLNGDRRTDLLRLSLGRGYLCGGSAGWSGGISQYAAGLPTSHFEGVRIADLNGDGMPDIVQGSRTQDGGQVQTFQGAWLSTGYGFASSPSFIPPANFHYIYTKTGDTGLRLADLNGDGRTDLIQSHRGKYAGTDWVTTRKAWISTGSGWAAADWYASNVGFFSYDGCPVGDTGQRIFDINGDGAADIVRSYRGSVNDGAWETQQFVQNGRISFPDLMTSARNIMGGTVYASYEPSTRWPQSSLPMVIPTVSRMTLDDGRGTTSDYYYQYAGATYDGDEQHFTGFAEVGEVLPFHAPGKSGSRLTRYLTDFAAAGRPSEDEAYDEDGERVWRVVYAYTVSSEMPYKAELDSLRGLTYSGSNVTETMSLYTHDRYGNLTSRTDLGDVWTSGDELRTDFLYYPNTEKFITGRVAEVSRFNGELATDPLLQHEYYYYDGATTATEPPEHGLLTEVKTWLGEGLGYASTRTEYGTNGEVTATYDPLNNKTEYLREDGYLVSEIRDPLYGSDPRHHATINEWDALCGAPLRAEDGNGSETTYSYDDFCRLTTTSLPGGGFEKMAYGQDQGQGGDLLVVRTERPSANGTSNWFRETHFDGMGRGWRVDSSGPGGDIIRTEAEYNARGMKVRQDMPFYASDGTADAFETVDYDVLGRPTQRKAADGSATTWAYGLLDTVITDPTGRKRKVIRDVRGREAEFLELNDGKWEGVASEFDVLGRRLSTTDQAGNVTTWAYDAAGRVLWEADADRGYTASSYDPAGRLENQVDAGGRSLCYEYDALGRRVVETTNCGSEDAETSRWVFDEARAGYYNVGHLTSQSGGATEAFDYDAAGNLSRRIRTIDRHAYSFGYEYDAEGRRTQTTYPDGSCMTWSYDEAGRPESISGVSADLTYGADGQLESWLNANGSAVTYDYSAERRWLTHALATHGSAAILDLNYEYAANGLLESVSGPFEHDSWRYEYDGAGKLTQAESVLQSGSYQYNSIGNLTYSTEVGAYAYSSPGQPRPHAPSKIANQYQSYDESGDREYRDSHFIRWDGKGRLQSVGLIVFGPDGMPIPAHFTEVGYDADGSRFKKVHNGVVTLYLGDGVEVTNGVYTKWVRAGGQLLGKVVGGEVHWLYTDHLGSVRAVQDAAGQVVCREAYQPYGEPLNGCTAGGASYTGQQLDETGLLFLNARYYDPAVGQFMSPDSMIPTRWPIGMNRYAYANGNPILFVDPTGHWSWRQTGGVFQMIGGGIEMIVGGVLVASCETGIGCVAAVGMMALGADTFAAGAVTVKNDEATMPYLQQGATRAGEGLGMDPESAAGFGFSVNFVTHVAVGGLAGAEAGVGAGLGGSGISIAEGSAAGAFLGISGTVTASAVATTVGAGIGAVVAATGAPAAMMSADRNGRGYRQKTRGANANDRKMVDDAARRAGIQDRRGFGRFIEQEKRAMGRGGSHNFTWDELLELAQEFKENGGR